MCDKSNLQATLKCIHVGGALEQYVAVCFNNILLAEVLEMLVCHCLHECSEWTSLKSYLNTALHGKCEMHTLFMSF